MSLMYGVLFGVWILFSGSGFGGSGVGSLPGGFWVFVVGGLGLFCFGGVGAAY